MGPFFAVNQHRISLLKGSVGNSDIRFLECFVLSSALLPDKPDPGLVFHFRDHACFALEPLLLGVVAMHVKGVLAPDPCRDLLFA